MEVAIVAWILCGIISAVSASANGGCTLSEFFIFLLLGPLGSITFQNLPSDVIFSVVKLLAARLLDSPTSDQTELYEFDCVQSVPNSRLLRRIVEYVRTGI